MNVVHEVHVDVHVHLHAVLLLRTFTFFDWYHPSRSMSTAHNYEGKQLSLLFIRATRSRWRIAPSQLVTLDVATFSRECCVVPFTVGRTSSVFAIAKHCHLELSLSHQLCFVLIYFCRELWRHWWGKFITGRARPSVKRERRFQSLSFRDIDFGGMFLWLLFVK